MIGQSPKRREDARLIVGRGKYINDVKLPRMVHAALLHSPHGHARIKSIDVSEALKLPGVIDAVTGEDLKRDIAPMASWFSIAGKKAPTEAHDFPMATSKVRYMGEPVAAVVAKDRYIAEDALELIKVEYETLPVVLDEVEACAEGAPLLFEEIGSNVYWHGTFNYGDVDKAFAEADRVIEKKIDFHRFSSTPLETYGAIGQYDPMENGMTIWAPFQAPGVFRPRIAASLGVPMNKLRLICPTDVGGGFGLKMPMQPWAIIVGYLSKRIGLPVKYIEDRMEHMTGGKHGTERTLFVKFALKNDGTILGFKARTYDNEGAYVHMPEPIGVILWSHTVQGSYHIRNIEMDCYSVLTNKTPVAPNRGYGRMQHQFMLERMMDIVARELGMSPVDVRLKNFVPADAFPYECTNGSLYDSGDYHECVRRALKALDYDSWKKEQAKARAEGRYLGIGLVSIMDPGVTNLAMTGLLDKDLRMSTEGEAATVKMDPSGGATVVTGSWGMGHETTCAQVAAHSLGIPFDRVYVVPGIDTSTHPLSGASGTYSSRQAPVFSGAIKGACEKIKDKCVKVAAAIWHADPNNIEYREGMIVNKTNPAQVMPLAQATAISIFNPAALQGLEAGMEATYIYNYSKSNCMDDQYRANFAATFANVVHACVLEIDRDTGVYKILKYVVVHDAGTMINPMIVDGQIHGATAHSLGAAMLEEFVYDENGQNLTGTFNEYLCPKSTDVPDMELIHMSTPSPFTAYGIKGMGEGGGPVPALIAQAIESALGNDPKIDIISSINIPETVFWLMEGQKQA